MHLVMKLSKLCNLRCTYCYEYPELANKERMPLAGIEFFFRSVAEAVLARGNKIPVHLVLHGGEPLLLPREYLQAVADLRDKYFAENGIRHSTAVQTNLFALSEKHLDLLRARDIGLGVSFDVFGGERVDIKGNDSQPRVLKNLQRLLDRGVPCGGICVLHAGNVARAENIYRFFNALDMDCRFLPMFATEAPEARTAHLMVSHEAIVGALKRVARLQFTETSRIDVYPLREYLDAAVRYLTGQDIGIFNPAEHEWALVVNTNGDTYSNSDPYLSAGYMGNVFSRSLSDIFASEQYAAVTRERVARGRVCRACPYDRHCDQLTLVEAINSERAYDAAGNLTCSIAKPLIDFMIEEIQRHPTAADLLQFQARAPAMRVPRTARAEESPVEALL